MDNGIAFFQGLVYALVIAAGMWGGIATGIWLVFR